MEGFNCQVKQRRFRRALLAGAVFLCFLLPGNGFGLDPARDLLQYNCQTWGRPNGLPVNGINAITQTKDGYLWLGTAVGLVRFDGIEFKLLDLGSLLEARSIIVNSLSSARDGGLWVGLEKSTFGFHDGQSFSCRARKVWGDVAPDVEYVNSIHESKDGIIWIGAEGAVLRLTHSGNYEEVLGASTNAMTKSASVNVLCVYEDTEGRLWFGTAGKGVYCWLAGKMTRIPDPALEATDVRALAEDKEGNIWVGTKDGLFCYDTNLVRKDKPPLFSEILALLVDGHGAVWIGTSGQGLACYRNGTYNFLRKTDGLASDYIRTLAEDREGSLWIGTRDGLSQLTDVKFTTQPAAEDPSVKDALAVCASRKGGIWVGSGVGLTYFDGKPKTYGVEAGLASPYVKRVFEAADGDVYLVSGTKNLVIFSGEKAVATYPAPDMVVGLGRRRAWRGGVSGRFALPRGQELFQALRFYQRHARAGLGSQPGFRPGRGNLGRLRQRNFSRQGRRLPAMGGGGRAFRPPRGMGLRRWRRRGLGSDAEWNDPAERQPNPVHQPEGRPV